MKSLICFVFGHKYRLKRKITVNIREIKCMRCGMEFGMNDDTETVLPLDDELKSLHKDLLGNVKPEYY